MKNKLTFLLLMLISVTVFSQARLYSSFDEIKEEFNHPEFHLISGIDEEGDLYINIFTTRTTTMYYFDKDNICIITFIIPDDEGELNYYVELYNKKYTILSEKKWRAYFTDGYANIELVFGKNYTYFKWTP